MKSNVTRAMMVRRYAVLYSRIIAMLRRLPQAEADIAREWFIRDVAGVGSKGGFLSFGDWEWSVQFFNEVNSDYDELEALFVDSVEDMFSATYIQTASQFDYDFASWTYSNLNLIGEQSELISDCVNLVQGILLR